MSDRLVDKIAALLAKAESTDSEHERDALISKAQELATSNAISLEAARQRKTDKTKRERPVQKRIALFDYSNKSRTKSLFVWLWVAIARENDVRVNIFQDSSGVIAFGFPSDIEVVETLYASLSVQMVAASNIYLKSGAYKSETVQVSERVGTDFWGDRYATVSKPLSGQTARRNFYQGFTSAIATRLRTARMEAESKVVDETVLDETLNLSPTPCNDSAPIVPVTGELVLREKREEVDEFYKSESRARGSYRGGRTSASSAGARTAGESAGHKANLGGSNAGLGSRKAIG